MKRALIPGLLTCVLASSLTAMPRGDDFKAVVKNIEQFYHVKHKSLPFLAKAGIKTATTAARLAGGKRKRIAEAGSVRVAFFEDQEFNSRGSIVEFKRSMNAILEPDWSPFIQTVAAREEDQTYIYLKQAGEHFHVLVVTIGRREGTVVQVKLAPETLAQLLKDPNELGKVINDDATMEDDQE